MQGNLEYNFDQKTCRFESRPGHSLIDVAPTLEAPLSVILQVTRRCNFDCLFCSETEQMTDPTLPELDTMRRHLKGVPRVHLSGGEPLLRKDFLDIAALFHDEFLVSLPTNGSIHSAIVSELATLVAYVNIGFEGPRNITDRMRGDSASIIRGINMFREIGIAISLTCVVLTSTLHSVPFTCQMADLLDARKLKIVPPIKKGNALTLPQAEYPTEEQLASLFEEIKNGKELYGWRSRITLTPWTKHTEGYSILVHPDGSTYAWPVYDANNNMLYPLGNLIREPIRALWARYPFKENHVNKYLGSGSYVC